MEKVILTPRLELFLQQRADGDDLRDFYAVRTDPGAALWSLAGLAKSMEETQRVLTKNLPVPISEYEGDIRKYRASYNIYLRSETQGQRDPSRFIGRIGVKECLEYGTPLPDSLTITDEKILKLEVGYAFLSKAWGKGYAPEALEALIEAYVDHAQGFWNPPFEHVYLHGVAGCANSRSRRVLEKTGFKLNGIHKWDGPDVFIGGAMQPPEVAVYSLGPLAAGNHREFQRSENP